MTTTSSTNESAQFGPTNIPFGVISTNDNPKPRIATRLFDQVFSLADLISRGYLDKLDDQTKSSLTQQTLNDFASLGRAKHRQVRELLQKVLESAASRNDNALTSCAVNVSEVQYHVPVRVGDFSDFSCSRDHVLNAGEAVLGKRELPPGFLHFPVGYGGRSSSILAPGMDVRRPLGQYRSPEGVVFGLSKAMDFELEVACVIGKPSNFGEPIDIDEADEHIFGFLLLNDWSARDIQGLEMNPLGPFNGKSLGTSISPWIVTADALEAYRVEGTKKDSAVAPYLQSNRKASHYSVRLGVDIEAEGASTTICQSQLAWLYWSVEDMIAHQTINGCPLNAGDILATGTVSGSQKGSHGCLLEITKGGKEPIDLKKGGQRTYLHDGDAVRLTGVTPDGIVGFGFCYGQLCAGQTFSKASHSSVNGST